MVKKYYCSATAEALVTRSILPPSLQGDINANAAGLPVIAITTDTSALTAIGNDYGYDHVFARQVEALAQEGNVLISISTSGNSKNVINALKAGRDSGCVTIGMSGCTGGIMHSVCDVNIMVPSDNTPRIQEMHFSIGHTICQIIDNEFRNVGQQIEFLNGRLFLLVF